MSDLKLPFVVFRYAQEGFRIGWGYLLVVNGQHWLCPREEDAKKDPRLAKMFPLDTELLEEQPRQPHDRQTFLYRQPLLESEEGYRAPPEGLGNFQGR